MKFSETLTALLRTLDPNLKHTGEEILNIVLAHLGICHIFATGEQPVTEVRLSDPSIQRVPQYLLPSFQGVIRRTNFSTARDACFAALGGGSTCSTLIAVEVGCEDATSALAGIRDAQKQGQPLLVLAVGIRMRSSHRFQDSEVAFHTKGHARTFSLTKVRVFFRSTICRFWLLTAKKRFVREMVSVS
jgi:hypothetical protein